MDDGIEADVQRMGVEGGSQPYHLSCRKDTFIKISAKMSQRRRGLDKNRLISEKVKEKNYILYSNTSNIVYGLLDVGCGVNG